MKKIGLLICIICALNCKETNSSEEVNRLVKSELQQISFNEIDEHPYFPKCNDFDGQANFNCFYKELKKHLLLNLDLKGVSIAEADEVKLQIKVNYQGKTSLVELQTNHPDSIQLHSVFSEQLEKFPKLFPAQKRGVLVNAVYQIPILINPKK